MNKKTIPLAARQQKLGFDQTEFRRLISDEARIQCHELLRKLLLAVVRNQAPERSVRHERQN